MSATADAILLVIMVIVVILVTIPLIVCFPAWSWLGILDRRLDSTRTAPYTILRNKHVIADDATLMIIFILHSRITYSHITSYPILRIASRYISSHIPHILVILQCCQLEFTSSHLTTTTTTIPHESRWTKNWQTWMKSIASVKLPDEESTKRHQQNRVSLLLHSKKCCRLIETELLTVHLCI